MCNETSQRNSWHRPQLSLLDGKISPGQRDATENASITRFSRSTYLSSYKFIAAHSRGYVSVRTIINFHGVAAHPHAGFGVLRERESKPLNSRESVSIHCDLAYKVSVTTLHNAPLRKRISSWIDRKLPAVRTCSLYEFVKRESSLQVSTDLVTRITFSMKEFRDLSVLRRRKGKGI